jgi:hypothetical protein
MNHVVLSPFDLKQQQKQQQQKKKHPHTENQGSRESTQTEASECHLIVCWARHATTQII